MFTFDENLISDLHKSARGFRPRELFFAAWNNSTDEQKQEIWNGFVREVEQVIEDDKAREQEAINNFENMIAANIQLGAQDRATAIRWIAQSFDSYDPGFICYELGLPFSFKDELRGAVL